MPLRCVPLHFFRAAVVLALVVVGSAAGAYETPAWPVDRVLPASEQSGAHFRVLDPVTSDGIMPQYRIETPYGAFEAYGHGHLVARLHELKALEVTRDTSELDVVAETTRRQVEGTLKTVAGVARDPLGTVGGLPRGIVNLFRGTAAQAREFGRSAAKATRKEKTKGKSKAGAPPDASAPPAKSPAERYAERYLGITAGERRWYERLTVDPYTDNEPLRQDIRHLAQVEAATSLGLRFASLPSVPYASDLQRVMNAVYQEDPAVLRERRREALLGYGLSEAELEAFEEAPALSPTRQLRLATAAARLADVQGLGELFRQASQLQSTDEAELYVASAELLGRLHAKQPLKQILPDLRLPAGAFNDAAGGVVVIAAESVFWTELTERGESSVRASLPGQMQPIELWVEGYVSDEALRELHARGWTVRAYAFDDMP